jgi:hypothetical protein
MVGPPESDGSRHGCKTFAELGRRTLYRTAANLGDPGSAAPQSIVPRNGLRFILFTWNQALRESLPIAGHTPMTRRADYIRAYLFSTVFLKRIAGARRT